jgi:hypothetical protein
MSAFDPKRTSVVSEVCRLYDCKARFGGLFFVAARSHRARPRKALFPDVLLTRIRAAS